MHTPGGWGCSSHPGLHVHTHIHEHLWVCTQVPAHEYSLSLRLLHTHPQMPKLPPQCGYGHRPHMYRNTHMRAHTRLGMAHCVLPYVHTGHPCSQAACLSPRLALAVLMEDCLLGWVAPQSAFGTLSRPSANHVWVQQEQGLQVWTGRGWRGPCPPWGPRPLFCWYLLGHHWVTLTCSPQLSWSSYTGEHWAILDPKLWFLSPLSPQKGTRDL